MHAILVLSTKQCLDMQHYISIFDSIEGFYPWISQQVADTRQETEQENVSFFFQLSSEILDINTNNYSDNHFLSDTYSYYDRNSC